jgi:hypothetical protein
VVSSLDLDEVLFVREETIHTQRFSTSIVDVTKDQRLDVVRGRSGKESKAWLKRRDADWIMVSRRD